MQSLAERAANVSGVIIDRSILVPVLNQVNVKRYYSYSRQNNLFPSLQQVRDFLQAQKELVTTETVFGWNSFLSGIETLGMIALAPILDDKQRENVLLFLENVAGFFPKKTQLKTYVTKYGEKYEGTNFVLQRNKDAIFLLKFAPQRYHYQSDQQREVIITEISTAKKPTLLPHHTLQEEIYTQQAYISSKKILGLVEKLRREKSFVLTAQVLDVFAQETGVSRGGAFYVLNVSIGNQFLHETDYAKTVRDQLGLKAKEMKIAEKEIPKLSLAQINRLYEGVLDTYWKHDIEKMAAKLAQNWNDVVGKREPISIALLEKAKKKFATGDYYSQKIDYTNFILIANGSIVEHSYLNDGKWSVADDGEVKNSCEDKACFDADDLKTFCKMILWLQTKLPVGDALIPGLVKLYAQTKDRLSNKEFLLCLEREWLEESQKNEGKTLQLLTTMLGKPQKKKCEYGESLTWNKKSHIVVLHMRNKYYFTFYFIICPALFRDEEIWNKMTAVAPHSTKGMSNYFCISLLRDKEFAAVIKRMENSPLQKGEFEANPALSAPKVVSKIEKKYKISREAATLYLQTLTLAEPTKANILEWNNWKTAQYKKATAELVDKKLLLHAKRKRAGREHFLPGAWLDLKAPHLPLELWKLPLYNASLDDENRLHTPLGTIVATKCIHELFCDAWQRISDGDIPQWEKM